MTIFADKRVFAREIETFLNVAEKVRLVRKTDEMISEAKLLSWFDSNADNIRGGLKSSEFENWFYGCLDRLDGQCDKQALTNTIVEIAKSDDEFHLSEQALIALTVNHWNLECRL